jgi:zinc transport system substrate-binding protein
MNRCFKKCFLALTVVAILVSFIGCSKIESKAANDISRIKIVTTIFPEYDWVKNILGPNPSNIENIMLLDSGIDLHNFQPTADDILKIASADLFIYVGGESDKWVDKALSTTGNSKVISINLLELLSDRVKHEEIVEGMEHEHEHDEHEEHEEHEHDEHEEHEEHEHEEHEHDAELDEHVWLSIKNAKVAVERICEAISNLDSKNKEVYEENTRNYIAKLDALDEEYEEVVKNSKVKTILFGDRFPFRYMADDYSLKYYAAFTGCSAETEASFETILFLSKKVDELSLKNIMKIEGSNTKIAQTIKDNTKDKNQNILTMDSMQSTTTKDINMGKTYISIMTDNLSVLKDALSK